MARRLTTNQEIAGSIPAVLIFFFYLFFIFLTLNTIIAFCLCPLLQHSKRLSAVLFTVVLSELDDFCSFQHLLKSWQNYFHDMAEFLVSYKGGYPRSQYFDLWRWK
jgi:hypothetical protein